jgi:hypothetical protein
MKATLETPLTRLPSAGLVWLDGRALTTVETLPVGLTFEMRPPRTGSLVLPVYGAAAPDTCVHCPTVEFEPPRPPSATYRFPSGPNVSPRGLLKPAAKTETFVPFGFFLPGGGPCFAGAVPLAIRAINAAASETAANSFRSLPF